MKLQKEENSGREGKLIKTILEKRQFKGKEKIIRET
jgi:hypothetical protein